MTVMKEVSGRGERKWNVRDGNNHWNINELWCRAFKFD
jgi:hypothetical protein